jgi:hypothetical protein
LNRAKRASTAYIITPLLKAFWQDTAEIFQKLMVFALVTD